MYPLSMRLSEKSVWLAILVIELTFMVLTRVILAQSHNSVLGAELLRTVLRIAAVLVYLALIPELINFKTPANSGASALHPVMLWAMALFLAASFFLVSTGGAPTPATRWVFAITSIPVALKEEITFRALIQNLLAKRFGTPIAVAMATALFVLYHVGVIAPNFASYAVVALAGLFFGVVYVRTQSLWLVIVLHAAYDMLVCLPALLVQNHVIGLFLLAASLALVCGWTVYSRQRSRNICGHLSSHCRQPSGAVRSQNPYDCNRCTAGPV